MTDETQEPGGKGESSNPEQRIVEELFGEYERVIAQDPVFVRYVLGTQLYALEMENILITELEDNERKGTLTEEEERELQNRREDIHRVSEAVALFEEVHRGSPLKAALKNHLSADQTVIHYVRSISNDIHYWSKGELPSQDNWFNYFEGHQISNVQDGVEASCRDQLGPVESLKGAERKEFMQKHKKARQKALKRAKKLDEELGQK